MRAPKGRSRKAKSVRPPKARSKDGEALPAQLSGSDTQKVLKILKSVRSIELKITVPLTEQRRILEAIGLDPVEAEPREAFFFDTPDLALNRAGLIVRARRFPEGRADTVVKLRPVEPTTVDPDMRRSDAFKLEIDVMPGGFVCSASFKGVCGSQEVSRAASGSMPLRKLFSKEQRAYYAAHAPKGLTMDKLVVLGPTFLLKARHQPKEFDRRITIELWLYPDGTRILEISTKSLPEEAFKVAAEFRAYLGSCGVVSVGDQSAKTRSSLAFFTRRLKTAKRKR